MCSIAVYSNANFSVYRAFMKELTTEFLYSISLSSLLHEDVYPFVLMLICVRSCLECYLLSEVVKIAIYGVGKGYGKMC